MPAVGVASIKPGLAEWVRRKKPVKTRVTANTMDRAARAYPVKPNHKKQFPLFFF